MNRCYTILVVDDEPDIVKSLQDLLRLDYRVLGANGAAEGLNVLEREEVHIVLTDQRMPGTSGVELLRHVLERYPDIVRLLLTGYADFSAVIEAINVGHVHSYVAKPWQTEELQRILREACEHYELNLDLKRLFSELQEKNLALEKARQDWEGTGAASPLEIQAVGHEFRNLLSVVLMLAQLVLRTAKLPGEAARYMRRIEKAARRLEFLFQEMDAGSTEMGGEPGSRGLRSSVHPIAPLARHS